MNFWIICVEKIKYTSLVSRDLVNVEYTNYFKYLFTVSSNDHSTYKLFCYYSFELFFSIKSSMLQSSIKSIEPFHQSCVGF